MGRLVIMRYLTELVWITVDTVTDVYTAVVALAHQKPENGVIGGI